MAGFTLHITPAQQLNDEPLSKSRRFEIYLLSNYGVYEELVRMAYRWKRDPRKGSRVGLDYFIAAIRWNDPDLVVHPEGEYVLNDKYTCFFARLIMKSEPPLDGLFELRTAREADDWIEGREPEDRINV